MKIQSTKNSHKKLLIPLFLIVFLLLACVGVTYTLSLLPFGNRNTSEQKKDSSTNTNKESSSDSDGLPDSTTKNTPSSSSSDNTTQNNKDNTTPSSEIRTDAAYPVTNEHFRIEQVSNRNFTITLYPVINNPEYADYNAQLKAYKQEALDYLTKRYGSVSDIGIEWNPEDAKDI